MKRSVVLVLALAVGCSDDRPGTATKRVEAPPRRVIEPPMGTVRPLPPHAIRADGVGPYKLGDKVAAVLAYLPSGPRIIRFEIPGVVRTSVIRAEDDTVLIGGETGSTSTFVAVVGPDVAFTEGNVHVGSTAAELALALGPLVEDLDRARDPRLSIGSRLRNARAILEGDRVRAIALIADPGGARSVEPTSCTRPGATDKAFGSCMGAGELVEHVDDQLVIRPVDRGAAAIRVRAQNVVFAAPLRNVNEGRDELVVVTRTDDDQHRRWSIAAYRLEGTRALSAVDPELVYQLSSAQTRWIGADLRDVDLYLELASRSDGIEVGGLLTARAGEKIRDVATLTPVLIGRRHGKPLAADAGDAGLPARIDATPQLDAVPTTGSANP